MYALKEVEAPDTTHGKFTDPYEASVEAARLNEVWKAEGSARRVRIVKEACEEAGKMYYLRGESIPASMHETPDSYRDHNVPIPVAGVAWRERELQRLNLGNLPWRYEPWSCESAFWAHHFPYPAEKDPAKIAFTASEEHGRADRQTVMRPGAYLERFYGDVLSAEDIRYWALEWANTFAPYDLHFARTADEIQHVYEVGPSSCMSHPASNYVGGVHPTRAYAGPDLAVAYIMRGEDITGRTVVWPARKQHARTYGDKERLEAALEREGYTIGSLEGARLARIEAENGGLHVPYLDGVQCARDDGEYVVIDEGGDLPCDSQSGVVNEVVPCDQCGHSCYEDDLHSASFLNGQYCQECFDELVSCCEACQKYAPCDDMCYVGEIPNHANVRGWRYAEHVCRSCYEEHVGTCDSCGTERLSEDLTCAPNDDNLCEACYAAQVTTCENCSEAIMEEDGPRCADCPPEATEEDETEAAA